MNAPPAVAPRLSEAELRVELRHARQILHLAVSALMMAKAARAQAHLPAQWHTRVDSATANAADAMQIIDGFLGE